MLSELSTFNTGHALMVRHRSALALDQIKAHRLASTCHHGLKTMLKHLTERCHESKAPSHSGTRTGFHRCFAAQAAFESLYQSSHTPTRPLLGATCTP